MHFTTFVAWCSFATVLAWSSWPWSPATCALVAVLVAVALYRNRRWHWECSHHGCDKCQDLKRNRSHCSWCVNTRCDGQTLEECQCNCHTYKYMPTVQPDASNTQCSTASAPGSAAPSFSSSCSCSGGMCVKGSCASTHGGGGVHCSCSAACSGEGPLYNFKKAFLLHAESNEWSGRAKETEEGEPIYDVLYAGAGLVNLMAAYHLLLNSRSQVRIVLVDPRSPLRDDPTRDFKVGESTLSPTSTFLFQELGLHDWMIEHCPLKHSLAWHFPKQFGGHTNGRQSDYFTIEETVPTQIPTYQLNRARLEAHLIQLILQKGGVYLRAHASIETLGVNGALHTLKCVEVPEGGDADAWDVTQAAGAENPSASPDGDAAADSSAPAPASSSDPVSSPRSPASPSGRVTRRLHGRHLMDGAGRKFLIATRKQLLLNKKEHVYDLDNAAVWIRVADADYSRFSLHGDSGSLVGRPIWSSSFYNTNHYMGPGYWIWVIPIELTGGRELSIGVTFHRQVYQASQFNTQAKMLAFLAANHSHLYDVCTGPSSRILDFHFLPRLAHRVSRTLSHEDNWCILGEAAYNADPFYSTGLVFASHQCMHATTLLLGKLAGSDPGLMGRYASAYNNFQVEMIKILILQIHDHHKHMGNAAVMSWRLYTEAAWLSHSVAAWFGRWILCPSFLAGACRGLRGARWVVRGQHDLYTLMDREGVNIGFMDMALPNLINLGGFDWFKRASPLRLWHMDDMIFAQQSEFQRTNVFKAKSDAFFSQACIMLVMLTRSFGWRGLFLRPEIAKIFWPRAAACLLVSVVDRMWGLAYSYRQYVARVPVSNFRAQVFHQFRKTYKPDKTRVPNAW